MKPSKKSASKGKTSVSPVKGNHSIISLFQRQSSPQTLYKKLTSPTKATSRVTPTPEIIAIDTDDEFDNGNTPRTVSKYFSPEKSKISGSDVRSLHGIKREVEVRSPISRLSLKRRRIVESRTDTYQIGNHAADEAGDGQSLASDVELHCGETTTASRKPCSNQMDLTNRCIDRKSDLTNESGLSRGVDVHMKRKPTSWIITGNTSSLPVVKYDASSSQAEDQNAISVRDSYGAILGKNCDGTGDSINRNKMDQINTSDGNSDSTKLDPSDAHLDENANGTGDVNHAGPGEGATETVSGEETEAMRVPYYLENFTMILTCVIHDEFYTHLFNEDDLDVIRTFQAFTDNSQKLYIRLFQRKHKWHRSAKITYPQIAGDLSKCLDELVQSKLLLDEDALDDLEDTLNVLPAPDIKILAKTLRLPSSAGGTREDLICAIYKHSQQASISNFFSAGSKKSNSSGAVLKRAKSALGRCYKLCGVRRAVFMRVVMLFSVHRTQSDEDDNAGAQQQLFEILMSNIGRVKYPDYTIQREQHIFPDRDSLLRFSSAVQLDSDLADALENKDWELSHQLYETAKSRAAVMLDDEAMLRHDRSLPAHLRSFTAGAVLVRTLSRGVELLQYRKLWTAAVDQLTSLLGQDVYQQDYRGRWWDRLALNVDFHLKQPIKAFDAVRDALNDPWVRAGHRYALWQRGHKLCHGNNKALKKRQGVMDSDSMAGVQEAPKVTIEGRLLTRSIPGANAVYIHDDGGGDDSADSVMMLKHVEDVALLHYRDNGYPDGIHGEGTTFSTLFCLFFWDVIFASGIADVFYNRYQLHPLDFYSDHFYSARQDMIDDRLEEIKAASVECLVAEAGKAWEDHQDTYCQGLSWSLFSDSHQLQGLVACMGGVVLAGIFERLVKQMRFVRSGVPDLVVWNSKRHTFRVVEVKGPGDRLSTKQVLWLDYLLSLGVQAEVCHVVGRCPLYEGGSSPVKRGKRWETGSEYRILYQSWGLQKLNPFTGRVALMHPVRQTGSCLNASRGAGRELH